MSDVATSFNQLMMIFHYYYIIIYTNISKFHGVIKKGHLGVMKNDFFPPTWKYFTSVTYKELSERITWYSRTTQTNEAKHITQNYSKGKASPRRLLLTFVGLCSSLVFVTAGKLFYMVHNFYSLSLTNTYTHIYTHKFTYIYTLIHTQTHSHTHTSTRTHSKRVKEACSIIIK